MLFNVPHTYADDKDSKSDTNSNIANVSEAASDRSVYGADGKSGMDGLLGTKFTSSDTSSGANQGLRTIAASWSFLGLNTDSGLLKQGEADTAEVSLQSLIIYNTDSNTTSNAVLKAASLPAVLQRNGLDTTKMGGLNSVARFVMGWILMAFLALAFIANAIIALVIWLIGSLNPFVIIQTLMNSSGYGVLQIPASWGDLPLIGNALDKNNVFGQVANLILSWTVPTLIIIAFGLVITMLFWVPHTRRSRTQGSLMVGLKKVLKQLFVLLILPSIAGSLFMSVYSLSANGVEAPARSVQNLVQSTFVQFGAWSDHSRLYLPPTDKYNNGIALKANVPEDSNNDSATKWRYTTPDQVPITPSYILAINALGARTDDANKAFEKKPSFEWSGISDTSQSDGGSSTAGNGNGDNLASLKTDVISKNMDQIAGLKNTFSMVDSWLSADRYSASSYAGTIENQYNSINKTKQQSYDQAGEIIKDINSPKDSDGKDLSKSVSEYLQTSRNAIRYDKDKGFFSNDVGSTPAANSTESLLGSESNYAGLSAIGMWNYLNSRVDKGTLIQSDPRKTQNKDAFTHANVVLPGGAVLGFLSIMIIIAFIAATTFPTLAVAILLGKMAMEAFTGWDKILFAMGGSIRAWMRLVQIGIKLIVGIFMLGFLSMITPAIASFVITELDKIFASTTNWGGYVVGKTLEVLALLAVAWFLYVAFKNSITFFDAIVPNAMKDNPGDPAGAAKSIFDRGFANNVDKMTSGSNSKLGRMLNEANEYDARHNKNLAHNPHGDLLKDSDGRWGLDADSEWRETEDGRSVQYLKNRDERADDRAKDREQFLRDWAQGPEATRLAKENQLKDELSNAREELQRMGIDLPEGDEKNATAMLKDMVKDSALLTPEMEDAAQRMQNAAESLEDVSEAKDELDADNKLDKFVKAPLQSAKNLAVGQGNEIKNAAMATEAGRLLKSYADARQIRSRAKTPEEAAARIAQERSLKEGKNVDDSEYGGLTREAQEELDAEIENPKIELDKATAAQNLATFQQKAHTEAAELQAESQNLKQKQAEIAQKKQALAKEAGLSPDINDYYRGDGKYSEERVQLDHIMDSYRKKKGIVGDPPEIQAHSDRTREALLTQNLSMGNPDYGEFLQEHGNELEKLGQTAHENAMVNKWKDSADRDLTLSDAEYDARKEEIRNGAANNYAASRAAQRQATRAVYDSIPDPADRMELMLDAQNSYASYMNDRIEKIAKNSDLYERSPEHARKLATEEALTGFLGDQPRNYGIFSSNVHKMMNEGVPREKAIQDAYRHAVTRNDEYQLLPRDFDKAELSHAIFGKETAPMRAQEMALDTQAQRLAEKQSVVDSRLDRMKAVINPVAPTTGGEANDRLRNDLAETGYDKFAAQTRKTSPVMRKYLKPNAPANLTVGQIYAPLKQYADIARAYRSQVPITGHEFTRQEKAARERTLRKLESMKTGLTKMGISDYALSDSERTAKMMTDFESVRNKFASTYADMQSKLDKI